MFLHILDLAISTFRDTGMTQPYYHDRDAGKHEDVVLFLDVNFITNSRSSG